MPKNINQSPVYESVALSTGPRVHPQQSLVFLTSLCQESTCVAVSLMESHQKPSNEHATLNINQPFSIKISVKVVLVIGQLYRSFCVRPSLFLVYTSIFVIVTCPFPHFSGKFTHVQLSFFSHILTFTRYCLLHTMV